MKDNIDKGEAVSTSVPLIGSTARDKAIRLISTSAEDCKSSLPHYDDLEVLSIAREEAETRNYKTMAKYISSRIRKLTVKR